MEKSENHINPDAFDKASPSQRADAKYFLHKYRNMLLLKENQRVIDIGSGNGFVTVRILKEIMGVACKIVGVDVSREMVDFSKQNYGTEDVSFEELDVLSNYLPSPFIENFDLAVSFYCLMWLHKQLGQAFQNINKILRKGGRTCLLFAAEHPAYTGWRTVSRIDAFAPYMKNVDDIIPIYEPYKDKKDWMTLLLRQKGFDIQICDVFERIHKFDSIDLYKDSLRAVNPFPIPIELQEQYYNAQILESESLQLVKEDDKTGILIKYKLFFIIADKV